jgi:predicted RND superfamily exporter protein
MTLTTPALLFPAISLLLLAYTNRFLTLAQLIRRLAEEERHEHHEVAARQILLLRKRITLTQRMQVAGVLSFLLCTLSMFALFLALQVAGVVLFGASLLTLAVSLLYSLWEVTISTNALNVQLQDIEALRERD